MASWEAGLSLHPSAGLACLQRPSDQHKPVAKCSLENPQSPPKLYKPIYISWETEPEYF